MYIPLFVLTKTFLSPSGVPWVLPLALLPPRPAPYPGLSAGTIFTEVFSLPGRLQLRPLAWFADIGFLVLMEGGVPVGQV